MLVVSFVAACRSLGFGLEEERPAFLRQEPYRKQKQIVDLPHEISPFELAIVHEAINQIMAFFSIIYFDPHSLERLNPVATPRGQLEFQPPPREASGRIKGARHLREWSVIGSDVIVLKAYFQGLLPDPTPASNTFVFVRTSKGWKFDRHELSTLK